MPMPMMTMRCLINVAVASDVKLDFEISKKPR